jgi:hypothetical protein
MATLTDEQQKQLDSLKALQAAAEPAPPPADPAASLPDVAGRLAALEATLGHPVNETVHRLVSLGQPRRVVDAAVAVDRVEFTAHPMTGQKVLVFDGKAAPRGVVVVDGVACYVELGKQTDAARAPAADDGAQA